MDAKVRSLDAAQVASTDLVALNNTVVNMRSTVKSAKVQVIHKLTRHIRKLKAKKGTDAEKQKNLRKAERMLEEIFVLKALQADKVSKFALANQTSFENICKQPNTSRELRCLARLAKHKQLSKKVADFRAQHADWQSLAAYLMVKQTGRRFKSKKQKEATKKSAHANITAARSVTHTYLTSKLGPDKKIDKLLMGPRPGRGKKLLPDNTDDSADLKENNQGSLNTTDASARSNADIDHGEKIRQKKGGSLLQKEESRRKNDENSVRISEDSGRDDGAHESDDEDENIGLKHSDDGDGEKDHASDSDLDTSKPWMNVQSDEDDDENNQSKDNAEDGDGVENVSSEDEDCVEEGDDNSDESEDGENSDEDADSSDKSKQGRTEIEKRKNQRTVQNEDDSEQNYNKAKHKTEMVVKRLDLNTAASDEIFADSPSGTVPDILLEEAPSRSKMAKDPFFLGIEGDSADDVSDTDETLTMPRKTHPYHDNDDDTPQQHEQRKLQSGMRAMESTFLDSLDSTKRNKHHSFEKRGRGSHPWNPRGRPFEREGFRGRGRGSRREVQSGRGRDRDFGRGKQRGGFGCQGYRSDSQDVGHGRDRNQGSQRGGRGLDRRRFQTSQGSDKNPSAAPRNPTGGGKGEEQQGVHPSWAASQKRKLQEKTTTFQGKRIKFDD